nr:MAG TPA: hypothetical protein [Caudoviricetes sp.]
MFVYLYMLTTYNRLFFLSQNTLQLCIRCK